jgi:hypothetical protein
MTNRVPRRRQDELFVKNLQVDGRDNIIFQIRDYIETNYGDKSLSTKTNKWPQLVKQIKFVYPETEGYIMQTPAEWSNERNQGQKESRAEQVKNVFDMDVKKYEELIEQQPPTDLFELTAWLMAVSGMRPSEVLDTTAHIRDGNLFVKASKALNHYYQLYLAGSVATPENVLEGMQKVQFRVVNTPMENPKYFVDNFTILMKERKHFLPSAKYFRDAHANYLTMNIEDESKRLQMKADILGHRGNLSVLHYNKVNVIKEKPIEKPKRVRKPKKVVDVVSEVIPEVKVEQVELVNPVIEAAEIINMEQKKMMKKTCPECGKSILSKNIKRHLKNVHKK